VSPAPPGARVDQLGIGLQYNPELVDWFPFDQAELDAVEVLLDAIAGPLDGPCVLLPDKAAMVDELSRARPVVIAHSNYGGEFGFTALEETAAVRRHVPLTKLLGSPWMSDHCFYGDGSWSDMWSSPIQFSRAEVRRLAARASRLQELLGVPLAHENAAYYVECAGADLDEPDFMAALVETADTSLHIDLHNIYTNSINLGRYSMSEYLDALPLERVVEIHIAGGSWSGGVYHDWHDSQVPEPVWQTLEELLCRSRPGAVVLEMQGRGHSARTRELDPAADVEVIMRDLERARLIWDHVYGPGSRHTTRSRAVPIGSGS
jgi:uncharacterized protein (UPF0276 family)